MWQMRSFRPSDQAAVQALINAGLGQRFGKLDESANLDIRDIKANYVDQDAVFLVVEDDKGTVIGCGALIHENNSDEIARIVRVSVIEAWQGHGLGKAISLRLISGAREKGYQRVLVETNSDWTSALRLYQGCGFVEYDRTLEKTYGFKEVHMQLEL